MTAAAAVHVRAPDSEPDMFAGTDAAPPVADTHLVLEITGVLIRSAEVRTKVVGQDQHPVPVLCMDLRPLSGLKRTIHAEQIYSESTRPLAEQKAATLKRGAQVTFTTSLNGMRTIFPHVQTVALHPQP